ncbi:MAG: cation:proton antiporter [Flavobacteriales bacterium]|nr:cation:proton antiporter [Flavobacteriales bacterium]
MTETFYDNALLTALVTLMLIAGLVMVRLVRGPSIADRATAFDVLTCVVIGMLAVFAIRTSNYRYFDVVLVMGFVVFLGAIGFAYYMKKIRSRK